MATSEARPTGDSDETGPIERRPFGQAVGFMLSQLGVEVTRRFGILMSKADLEARQWGVMRTVAQTEGQSQNALAEFLHIPPSSMVALIDHLESRGLLERRQDPADRRSWRLHITPAGRSVIEGASELAVGFEQTLCAGFTPDQRRQLMEMLGHIAGNLGLARGVHPHWGQGPKGDEPAGSS